MKSGILVRSLALPILAAVAGLRAGAAAEREGAFPDWAFCVAYQVRDADEREARPVGPGSPDDPFRDGETSIPRNLINERHIVDVAALSTRVVKSRLLKRKAAEGVVQGATGGTGRHPLMDCYEPHHLFVFYGFEGNPVAAIEVCFACNRVKMVPEIRDGKGIVGSFETADLAALAKIASEAGLDRKRHAPDAAPDGDGQPPAESPTPPD